MKDTKTPEQMRDEKREKDLERSKLGSEIARELLADARFPILLEYIERESAKAARGLSSILADGIKPIRKGDEWCEEVLSVENQLVEARCLAYKCNFLNGFIRSPQDAIDAYSKDLTREKQEHWQYEE